MHPCMLAHAVVLLCQAAVTALLQASGTATGRNRWMIHAAPYQCCLLEYLSICSNNGAYCFALQANVFQNTFGFGRDSKKAQKELGDYNDMFFNADAGAAAAPMEVGTGHTAALLLFANILMQAYCLLAALVVRN